MRDKGGSTHWDQHIRLKFTADVMTKCIAEIKDVEAEAEQMGTKPKRSWNQITGNYGLSPLTVSKQLRGKVIGIGAQVGGARRGRIFQAG